MEVLKNDWRRHLLIVGFFSIGFFIAFRPYVQNTYYNIFGSVVSAAGVLAAIVTHRMYQAREMVRILKEKNRHLSVRVHHLQRDLIDMIPLSGGVVERTLDGIWHIGFPYNTYTTPGAGVTHYHLAGHPEYVLVLSTNNRGVSSLVASQIISLPFSGTTTCS